MEGWTDYLKEGYIWVLFVLFIVAVISKVFAWVFETAGDIFWKLIFEKAGRYIAYLFVFGLFAEVVRKTWQLARGQVS
jgi:hypothetical protein